MISKRFLCTTALPLAMFAAQPAEAEMRAVLVGVSDYHVLDADLRGPRNDVRLMADALIARGADPALIQVMTTPGTPLADGLPPAEDPTRAAILAALDELARVAQPGDVIVFYYSGHGSQAPDLNGDEAGGYDEIILPSDAANWKGATRMVENAIVDDELQAKMQAILDTGAQLVAIMDACHSATGFRALGAEGVARYISPASLGVPTTFGAPDEAGQINPPLTGDFVFLYSAQADERAFEYPVGDAANPDNWYGDFTRNLTLALEEIESLTWAQALAVSADGLLQEQAPQTPDGEGTALEKLVFGTGGGTPERMRIEGGRLMAGRLEGLAPGAVVELWDAAVGGTMLGTAVLGKVEAGEAALRTDVTLPDTAYAVLQTPGAPEPLRMAPPVVADGGDYTGAMAELTRIAEGGLVDGLTWGPDDSDLQLVLTEGNIVLVGPDGVVDPQGEGSSPSLPAESAPDVILEFIQRAVKVDRLRSALAMAEGKTGFTLPGAVLKVEGEVLAAAREGGVCEDPGGMSAKLTSGGAVSDCDQVWLTLTNGSSTPRDVTVLYIDRDMRVWPVWPEAGLSNRIAKGESVDVGMLIDAEKVKAGIEEIVVIAVPARDGAPRTVLTSLADPAATKGEGTGSETGNWLLAAANPEIEGTKGFYGKTDAVKVTRLKVRLTQ